MTTRDQASFCKQWVTRLVVNAWSSRGQCVASLVASRWSPAGDVRPRLIKQPLYPLEGSELIPRARESRYSIFRAEMYSLWQKKGFRSNLRTVVLDGFPLAAA